MDKRLKTVSSPRQTAGIVFFLAGLAAIAVVVTLEIRLYLLQGSNAHLLPASSAMPGHAIVQAILALAGIGFLTTGFKLRESATASLLSDAKTLHASLAAQTDAFTELEKNIRERSTELIRPTHDLGV